MSAQHPTAARGIARAIRQLTVGYVRKRHEDRKTRETRRYTRHAALSLNGDWLEQAGFPVGTQVRVSVSPGKLVIENLELAAPGTGLPSGQSCAAWRARFAAGLVVRGLQLSKAALALPACQLLIHPGNGLFHRLGHRIIKTDDIRLNAEENHLADVLFQLIDQIVERHVMGGHHKHLGDVVGIDDANVAGV